jgi:glucan phosphoethanolaminetransferase (alkaline phosphatase superfamily)
MCSLPRAALDGPEGFVIKSLAGTVLATHTPAMVLRLLAATALLLAPYLLMGFWLGEHVSVHAAAGYAAVVLASLWLLAYLAKTWRRFFLFHTPLFLASVVFIGYAIISAQLPGDPIAYVLVTSSWEEVYGFFGLGQEQRLLMLFIAGLAVYLGLSLWLSPRATPAVGRTRFRTLAFGSLAALIAFAAIVPVDFMTALAATPLIGSAMFLTGPLSAANAQIHGNLVKKIPYGAAHVASAEVHILIVGESSRRDSWSAYGYSRPTTPFMAVLKGEAIFFDHAVTDSNATVCAVPMLLTGIGPEAYEVGAIRGNLVDLAKEAGYFTSWLVNQDANISYLVGMNADQATYPHSTLETTTRVLRPDGTLLSGLQRQLERGGPLFIGLHVDGSHWAYFDRYPRSFEKFGSGAGLTFASFYGAHADHRMLDSYDNSILYTDWFLQQVIEQARKLKVPATVTYLSDHGESLYALDGRTGHGASDYASVEFDIPAFVWVNAAYRAAHPDKVQALTSNADKEIRTHDFFYSLADLMGIRWPGNSPERSFASPNFIPDTHSRHLAGGRLVARAVDLASDR